MNLVVLAAKARIRQRPGGGIQEMLLLVTDAPSTSVDLLEELPIVAMKLFRIDTHDRT